MAARLAIQDADPIDRDGAQAWPELYQELGRLPERFRLPILLCHLEGLTYDQAAERLGCPVRTVQSRLARGRARLRDRLPRRGVAPAIAALTAALIPDASASLAESWARETAAAAVRFASGGRAAALIPATISILARGAARTMNMRRLIKWAVAFSLIGTMAGGAAVGMLAEPAAPPPEQGTKAVADDQQHRATFKGGATIEVVGVSTVPSHTWWKPDGSPLAEAPVDTIPRKSSAHQGQQARVILLRVSGVKRGDNFRWQPTRSASYWGGRPSKNGERTPELEVQFRPFELAEIKGIALNPRSTAKPIHEDRRPAPEIRPSTASAAVDPDADTDGDGLSDFQEIHKYRTDPRKFSTAGDGSPTAIGSAAGSLPTRSARSSR